MYLKIGMLVFVHVHVKITRAGAFNPGLYTCTSSQPFRVKITQLYV